jgi:hypothetical protein
MKWYCALLLLISSTGLSAPKDPQGLLIQIDKFLAAPPFEHAFIVGDSITVFFHEHGSSGYPYRVKVEQSDHGLLINSYSENGTAFNSHPITLDAWESMQRNLVRQKIQFVESFGFEVTVEDLRSTKCPQVKGLPKETECKLAVFSGVNQIGYATHYELIIDPNQMGLAQILYSKQDDKGLISRTIEQSVLEIHRP